MYLKRFNYATAGMKIDLSKIGQFFCLREVHNFWRRIKCVGFFFLHKIFYQPKHAKFCRCFPKKNGPLFRR